MADQRLRPSRAAKRSVVRRMVIEAPAAPHRAIPYRSPGTHWEHQCPAGWGMSRKAFALCPSAGFHARGIPALLFVLPAFFKRFPGLAPHACQPRMKASTT